MTISKIFRKKFQRLRHENILELQISSLIFFIVEMQNTFFNFHVAIQAAIENKLSPFLFPPNVLLNILNSIKTSVRKPSEIIIPANDNTLYEYFSLTKARVQFIKKNLVIDILFPISDSGDNFEMYEVIPVPQPMTNASNYFIKWELEPYLLVDINRRFHIAMSESQSLSCKGNNLVICNVRLPIHTTNDQLCEFALFMNESVTSCKLSVQILKH